MVYTKIKGIICLILSTVLMFIVTGCSTAKQYDAVQLSEKISKLATFSEMTELSGTSLPYYFFFKDSDVKKFSVKVSATDSADTLACFEVKNEEQRSIVKEGIKKYLTNLSGSPKSPQESVKIENRLLVELDNVIILVICNDTAPAWDYLKGLGAKESI